MTSASRALIAALAILSVASPAAAQTPSTPLGAGEVTERFARTARLDPNGTLDLTNLSGNVVVSAASGREVTIEAIKRVQRPNANAARNLLAMIDIQVTGDPGRVEVRTVYPRPRNFPGAVDYTVTVPADTSVIARTTTGTIRATGVTIDTVRVVSGSIDIADASAADFASVGTVSGPITIRGLSARNLQLTTVSGDIHLERVRSERLMARATSGTIDYAGELARNGRYELVSHSGDIRLALADDARFEVVANTLSGNVRSEFDITRRGGEGRGGRGGGVGTRGLRGVYGGGGTRLVLRAFSGNIVLTRR